MFVPGRGAGWSLREFETEDGMKYDRFGSFELNRHGPYGVSVLAFDKPLVLAIHRERLHR